jgi:hypothetical protein
MGRRNHTRRKPQARRRADGTRFQSRPPAQPVETLVVPHGKCFYRSRKGKMIFTQNEAEKALRQAQADRVRRGSAYVEKRVYECPEGGCGGWHLTSRETWVDREKAS